jgi:deoxyribose-phosphate aldolase
VKINSYIENTLLKSDATSQDIKVLCDESMELGFLGVCVNPRYVNLCQKLLAGSPVAIVTVIGFPLGANSTSIKALETAQAIRDGATEIDMVIAIGALKENDISYVEADIFAVVKAAAGAPVKVIIETALLTEREKIEACKASARAGAKFVKTCTGFSGGGATVSDIQLMRAAIPPEMKIKASGGIKNLQHAKELIQAGAFRLGTSSGRSIVAGNEATPAFY